MSDHLVALIPLSHPLASSPSITLQQLKNDRFCFIKEGSLMYQMSMDARQNAVLFQISFLPVTELIPF